MRNAATSMPRIVLVAAAVWLAGCASNPPAPVVDLSLPNENAPASSASVTPAQTTYRVVRGDTRHYEQVADGCAEGLMRVALEHAVPVLNGVLAVELHADAAARAGGARGNKGEEVALAALEMADLWRRL